MQYVVALCAEQRFLRTLADSGRRAVRPDCPILARQPCAVSPWEHPTGGYTIQGARGAPTGARVRSPRRGGSCMQAEFSWYIPAAGDGHYLCTRHPERLPTHEYLAQVARAAEYA